MSISVPALADSVHDNGFTVTYDSDLIYSNGLYVSDFSLIGVYDGHSHYTGVGHWDYKPMISYSISSAPARTLYLSGVLTFTYYTQIIPLHYDSFDVDVTGYEPQFLIDSVSNAYMSTSSYIVPDDYTVVVNVYFYNYPLNYDVSYIDSPSISISQGFNLWVSPDAEFDLDSGYLSVTQGIVPGTMSSSVSVSDFPDTSKGLADIITQSVIVGILQAQQSGDTSRIISLLNSMLAIDDYSFNAIIQYLGSISTNNVEIVDILRTILSGDRALYLEFTRRMSTMQSSLGDIATLLDELVHGTAPSDLQTAASSIVGGFQGGIAVMDDLARPDIQGVISSISVDQSSLNGTDRDIFYYLYSSRILQFLMVTFSIAILGYVLYGRGT